MSDGDLPGFDGLHELGATGVQHAGGLLDAARADVQQPGRVIG
jgi:hypothetical protein